MIVHNGADGILPVIQVGCMMYGSLGMYRGRMGIMGIIRNSMGRMRGGDQDQTKSDFDFILFLIRWHHSTGKACKSD